MAKRLLSFDKTEVVAVVVLTNDVGKTKNKIMNFSYDKFIKITFEKCTETRLLFLEKESERIVLNLVGMGKPVIYTKSKCGDLFEEYKKSFRQFAKDNRIELIES